MIAPEETRAEGKSVLEPDYGWLILGRLVTWFSCPYWILWNRAGAMAL